MATIPFSEGSPSPPKAIAQRKQLLNNIVDGMAQTRPSAIYAEIPRDFDDYTAGYRTVTYSDLANGINGVAWWLREHLGEGKIHQTLAYIGPNDIGYVMMILGAVKAGYKMLLVSPRNTLSDHVSLFEATDCEVLMTTIRTASPLVEQVQSKRKTQILFSPSLDILLDHKYPHYPYQKSFIDARGEPLLVLHTSGTTAVPKPIVYTHDFAASYIQWGQLRPSDGFHTQVSLCQSNRLFVALPLFHSGGVYATLFEALANQTTIITPLSGVLPSAQNIVDGLKHVKADAIFLAPPFLEQIAKTTEMLESVTSKVDTIVYSGGPVSEWSGEGMTSRVRLFNFHGSTEIGSIPLLRPSGQYPSEDWRHIHPHPLARVEFRSLGEGEYEAVIVRHSAYEDEQPVFKIFPKLKEYHTKDLFKPHPTKPDLWAFSRRADDTIIFRPGYMCDPIPFEERLVQSPGVTSVLMAGAGHWQPILLIEPTNPRSLTPAEEIALTDRIWPLIQEINQSYILGARVAKSHIIYTSLEKPMRRAGKGTIQRALTLKEYEEELETLYAKQGDGDPSNQLVLPVATHGN